MALTAWGGHQGPQGRQQADLGTAEAQLVEVDVKEGIDERRHPLAQAIPELQGPAAPQPYYSHCSNWPYIR